jgi:hypothetical protein
VHAADRPDPDAAVRFTRELLPALGRVQAQTGIAESLLLAMAAVASGWGADPSGAWRQDPWALPAPVHAPASLDEAATELARRLHPAAGEAAARAWALRSDPEAFLEALAAAGWSAPRPPAAWAATVAAQRPFAAAALAVAAAGVPAALAFGPPPGPLSLSAAAALARRHLPPAAAALMLAIGAATTGLDPLAAGRPWDGYPDADLVRELAACVHPAARPLPTAGTGPHAGFGWMLLDMAAQSRALVRESRCTDPLVWAWWLFVPEHTADLAASIGGGPQGWSGWPAYADGSYRSHLAAAREAVAVVG